MDFVSISKMFGAFFAIMNPFVNLPMFLSLTGDNSVGEQRAIALKVLMYSLVMCAAILLAGQQIIQFFGITVDQFRIAGGLVLGHIAWNMVNGEPSAAHHGSSGEKAHLNNLSSIAFCPITFPMIVGPGTIATIIIYTGQSQSFAHLSALAVVIASIIALLFITFFFASSFGKMLTATARMIMTRLMGMILLSIAVEMLIAGLQVEFPILKG